MPSRFVFLSDHSLHARFLVDEFVTRRVPLDAVLVQSASRMRGGRGLKYRLGSLIWPLRARLHFYRYHKSFYAPLQTRVIAAGEANSARMQRVLSELAPDYILVGSGSILKPNVIETAKCGVFNVHPGLLPWMRGSGVVGHALERGVPLGATLHYIDAGIDTGALIERRLLPITKASCKLSQLERECAQLAARLMADAVLGILESGQKPPSIQQTVRFPLFRWFDKDKRPALDALAQSGRALELFEAWKPLADGEPNWTLPPDLMEAPF